MRILLIVLLILVSIIAYIGWTRPKFEHVQDDIDNMTKKTVFIIGYDPDLNFNGLPIINKTHIDSNYRITSFRNKEDYENFLKKIYIAEAQK